MKKFYFSIPSITFLTSSYLKGTSCFVFNRFQFKSIGVDSISVKKLRFLGLLFVFLISTIQLLSQSDSSVKKHNDFNELYWKTMAMKKFLNPDETKEFLNFQKIRAQYPDSFTYKSDDKHTLGNHGRIIGGGSLTQTTATGCNNIDFEAGSTSGWTLTSGFHPNSSSTPTCCPTTGAQNLITSAGVDPYGGFPTVFPGGNFSLRLGNNGTGAQADRLQQKIFVTPANANFTYRYAVVLQDPGHNTVEQPAFTIEMIDTLGNQVPCTYYNVSAGSNIPGFFSSTVTAGVIYKPWTSVVVDLTPNIGQNVFIRFTTYDCSLGGHFGYAYIDGFCTDFATDVADTTCPGVPITMCGPVGFGFYDWTGPGITSNTNQCISVMTPGVYTCQTILVPGCPGPTFTHTLNTLFKPVLSFTPSTNNACALNYSFASTSSIATGSVVSYSWNLGNSTSSTIPNPVSSYSSFGTYTVMFKATSNRSCSDSVTQTITIYPNPVIGFSPPNSCLNSIVQFSSTSTIAVGSVNTFTWNFGNGVVSTATNPTNTYTLIGPYNVTLSATSDQGCTSTASGSLVIHPLPVVSFSATNLCLGNTTNFNPTVTISAGSISSFNWNLGNGVTSTNFSTSTNYSAAGNYVVTYTATSNQQCLSAQTQTVSIYPLPVVSFTPSGACFNTPTSFVPSMSVALGSISSYSWNFGDGNNLGAINNPTHTYSSVNTYTPSFTAISNFGCFSTITNTAIVYPLPNTAFLATVQCINSPITFSNTSSIGSGSLSSFLWNFGGAATSTSINPIFTFTNSGVNTVTLTATSDQSCVASHTTSIIIQQLPTVSIVPSSTLCSNIATISLNGTVTGISSTGQWSSSGTGAFTNSTSLNTTYTISAGDIANGQVIFTLSSTNNSACASQNNTNTLSITPLATVSAGPNTNVCSSQNNLTLNGSVNSPSSSGVWATAGTGTFAPTNQLLNTSYSITPADINSALVIFTLSSTNNGTCPAVSDTVMMRISKQPTVNAMPSLTLCSSASVVALSGTVTGNTNTGTWSSSGSGAFSNANLSNSIYTITSADKLTGLINFTYSSTNNGVCPAASQNLSLSISPLATVNAGPNFTICSTQSLNLNANIIGSTNTGTWSSTGNGTFTSINSLTTAYIPGSTDLLFGVVDLYLTSTNNGFCQPIKDTVHIVINKQASVTVNPTMAICSSINTLALTGSVVGTSTSGSWATSGTGSFNNASQLNSIYNLSTSDKTLSTLIFTLASTNNGACVQASQTITVSIIPIAVVDAGINQVICSANQSVALSGTVINSPAVKWTSSTGGTYANSGSLSAVYYFSSNDIINGLATLTLSSLNNSVCPTVSDTLQIRIIRQATANAGPDLSLCSNNNSITLPGQVVGSTTTGTWTTNGAGIFSPSNTAYTSYQVGAGDLNLSALQFILYSTNNNICNVASDTLNIRIAIQPSVIVSGDTTLCQKQNPIQLNGLIKNGSGAQKWTTNGTGSFTPNAFANPTKYYFSANDFQIGSVLFSLNSLNGNACGNITSSFFALILPSPKIKFSVSSNNLTLPSNSVALINESTGAVSYTWSYGNGAGSTNTNAVAVYNDVGYYKITLVGENENKCADSTSTYISIISDVLWPNAFTPNPQGSNGGRYEDGNFNNDVFFPFVKGVAQFDMMIFNRWGQMLFETKDLKVGWDGYFNGKLCQQDIYVWKANIVFLDGREYTKTGSISLIR